MEIINTLASVLAMGIGMYAAAKVTHTVVNEINLMMTPLFKKFGRNAVEAEKSLAQKQVTFK